MSYVKQKEKIYMAPKSTRTSFCGKEFNTAPSMLSQICFNPAILKLLGKSLFALNASSSTWSSCGRHGAFATIPASESDGMHTNTSAVSCSKVSAGLEAFKAALLDIAAVGSRYCRISMERSSHRSVMLIRGASLSLSSVPWCYNSVLMSL